MEKVLGLDLGTNSIGWAVIVKENNSTSLLKYGVHLFQEGVKIEKGIESSKAADRTGHRSLRKHYFRRRLRKAETLKVLSQLGLCPVVSNDMINMWLSEGKYPLTDDIFNWLKTDDRNDKNPYRCRFDAIDKKLNLNIVNDKYILGRAFYHIAQRRGFLSNRLETAKSSDDGKVSESITIISEQINKNGCRTLGEYFYKCYGKEKIRGRYTARVAHYKAEFDAICKKQELREEDIKLLENAIFYQRPLRSQKGLVGNCTFEKKKSRCPISHPCFEYYRMLCFLNSIKIKTPIDDKLRFLTIQEKESIIPLFMRVTESFIFEDIAKKIAGRGNYSYIKDIGEKPYKFNYRMDTPVSGCPLSAKLKNVFGEEWKEKLFQCYTLRKNKTKDQVVNDIWHVLFTFSSADALLKYAKEKLDLDEALAEKFSKISVQGGYASLSIKAINKILPFLEQGKIYSYAVFLANLGNVLPNGIWNNIDNRNLIINGVLNEIDNYDYSCGYTLKHNIISFLRDNFELVNNADEKLYHPSMIETYKQSESGFLESPRTNAIRNPMAMRSIFQLRKLVNKLLVEGVIDVDTKINIELSRNLNNANMRNAISLWQKELNSKKEAYKKKIIENSEIGILVPTDDDILKYQLWEEQNHKCLYTGKNIALSDFLGPNPKYDIEHTIPRSIGGDNSQMNKTLADSYYNREIKGTRIPSELTDHEAIMERISHWKDKIETLEKAYQYNKRRKSFIDKDEKDRHIIKRNRIRLELDYWRGKYERFVIKEYNHSFKASQGVDAGIISKYARLYLKSLFPKVYSIKGEMTAEFRKLWGLQLDYEKKSRTNHIHHCIDAITIACIGKYSYDELSYYYAKYEGYKHSEIINKPNFAKPWDTFTEDVKLIYQKVLVTNYTPDNLGKNTKKRQRIRGRVLENKFLQGDTARGSLHQDTHYGAIMNNDSIKYVVRKSLSSLKESDVNSIVDDVVRQKVESAVKHLGFKNAMTSDIWMNEEKKIPIRKVRCFTPLVQDPLHIREHRDKSRFEYKQQIHVVNDSNYCMSIYEGVDKKGKLKRSYLIVNNIKAASFYKKSNNERTNNSLIPNSKDGLLLKSIIKTGTKVIFWKESPDEILKLDKSELVKRLYKVTKMSKDGRLTFRYHQEARTNEQLKIDFFNNNGGNAPKSLTDGVSKFQFDLEPVLLLSPINFNMLVEGYDFELTIIGDIKPIEKC